MLSVLTFNLEPAPLGLALVKDCKLAVLLGPCWNPILIAPPPVTAVGLLDLTAALACFNSLSCLRTSAVVINFSY